MAQSNSTSRKDSNSSGEFEAKEARLYPDEPDLGGKYFAFEFGALRCAKLAASF